MREITRYFTEELYELFEKIPHEMTDKIKEIRLRANMPIVLYMGDKSLILHKNGQVDKNIHSGYIISKNDLKDLLSSFCQHSMHSYQNEIKHGFITIEGGHRVGLCGTCIVEDKKIIGVKDISSMNIRIAREINGISKEIFNKIFANGLQSVLIIGAPTSGKTTLIKDIARKLSSGENGEIVKVAIIDERSEIAATHNGIAKNDVGVSADIYNLYPKDIAMNIALRSGSPQVFICDEIGNEDDVDLILQSINTGVHIIATAHGQDLEQIKKRNHLNKLLQNNIFSKIVVLGESNAQIKQIIEI